MDPIVVIEPGSSRTEKSTAGYRDVIRDRFYVRLLPVDLALGTMFGLAFMVMPTTFVKRLGASEKVVGLIVMSGAVAVIVTQVGISRIVRGRARMLALALMSALFAIALGRGRRFSVGTRRARLKLGFYRGDAFSDRVLRETCDAIDTEF